MLTIIMLHSIAVGLNLYAVTARQLPQNRYLPSGILLTNYTEYVQIGSKISFTCETVNLKVLGFKIYHRRNSSVSSIIILKTDRNGKYIKSSMFEYVYPLYHQRKNKNGKNSISVRSKPATEKYSGRYTCEALVDTNSDGKTDERHQNIQQIFVGKPPSSVQMSTKLASVDKQVFKENEVVTILCTTIMEDPSGKLSFYLKNTRYSTTLIRSNSFNKYILAKSFKLNNPSKFDGAQIKCVASDRYGQSENSSYLHVEYKPTIDLITANEKADRNIVIYAGQDIQCRSRGNPLPQAEWKSPNTTYFQIVQASPNIIRSKIISKSVTVKVICHVTQQSTDTEIQKEFTVKIAHNPWITTVKTTFDNKMNLMLLVALSISGCFCVFLIVKLVCQRNKQKPFPRYMSVVSILHSRKHNLLTACENGELNTANLLIKTGDDINQVNANGDTALILASANGYAALVQVLIENEAAINHRNESGQTALFKASENGHVDVVDILVQNDARVDLEDLNSTTAIEIARKNGQKGVVNVLNKVATLSVIQCDRRIDAVYCAKAGQPTFAATMLNNNNCEESEEKILRTWTQEDLCWKENDLVINHSIDSCNREKDDAVMAILDDTLLVEISLDDEWRSQFISVDSTSGQVLHKSKVRQYRSFPSYCCYQSQILIPDEQSSTITHLRVPELDDLFTWSHEQVKEPWRVCSNKNRIAVCDFADKIHVFEWINDKPSDSILHELTLSGWCTALHLMEDDSLVAINNHDEWSVWRENGIIVHKSVPHPALSDGMKINQWLLLQDLTTGQWFAQEFGKLADGTNCKVIYSVNLILERLQSGNQSTIKNIKSENLNKTLHVKID